MFPLKQMQNHPSSFVNLKGFFFKRKEKCSKAWKYHQRKQWITKGMGLPRKKKSQYIFRKLQQYLHTFLCYLKFFFKNLWQSNLYFLLKIQPQVKNTSFLLSFYRVICQTSPTDRTPLFAPILRRRVPVVPVSQNIQNSEISSLKLHTLPLRLKKY